MTTQSPIAQVFSDRVHESAKTKLLLLEQTHTLEAIAQALLDVYKSGGKTMFIGNGGSAADALHLAAELTGRYYQDREPLPSMALVSNISGVTAIGNDYGYDQTFSRQVRAFGASGDALIALSTSGNSENVIAACQVAKELGVTTIGLTGQMGGRLAGCTDICLRVPTSDTPRVQECHLMVGHIVCEIIENALVGQQLGRRERAA